MKLFACLLAPRDQSIPDSARSAIEKFPRAHAIPFYWTECEQAAVLIGGHAPNDGPPVARYAGRLAVGSVRLDNRIDCERWAACDSSSLTDIELVLRVVVQHGPDYISRFVGDFAFIVWHPSTAVALAACDAFAVKKLYYAQRDGLLCFSSRSAALAYDNDYDTQYFAEQVAVCVPTPGLTPYRGVSAVPPASIVDVRNGRTHTSSYWSPFDFAFGPPSTRSQSEAVAICRDLLRDAVQSRLTGSPDVWAHLSGGLDSSSVVSLAQWLATTGATPQGLAGTITYVDSHGTGADEREYSEAVVARWNVRNETIVDPPVWYDERFPLPDTDAPRVGLIFYPRECLLCATIRGAGGHVVLTGAGGDTLFAGSMFFFADWLSRGRIRPTMREMLHRAAIGRVSFWELAYRNVILPLLPPSVQRRLVVDPGQMPPWLLQTAISRYGLSERS
ncbi:MAG: hypothetical protein IRY91_07290, partial [Gemmatimonadaceae bacterium]|nr:hypothetical protein [Gemmatimonadaceae bacterium]